MTHFSSRRRPRFGPLLWLALSLFCALVAPRAAHALPSEFVGSIDAFYTMPSTPPTAPHGTVLRWQRMITLSPGLIFNSDGVAGFRMMYVSTAADGVTPTYVTGSVLVPARLYNGYYGLPQAPRPIIGFAAGSQGFADGCASAFGLQQGDNYDIVLIRQALDKGWAVVVSDYQGLGTRRADGGRDDHTYVVGKVLGRNVIDSVRASYEFDGVATSAIHNIDYPLRIGVNAVLRTNSRVAFWGYSEGGGAAAWAAQLQPTYDPGINLKAVAAGGIPADLLTAGEAINNRTNPQNLAFGVLIGAMIGYKQAYPELPFEENFSNDGKSLINDVRNSCIVDAVIHGFGFRLITDYTNGFNPLTDQQWKGRLNENKLGATAPKVPAFVYHASSDEALIYSQGRQLARDWCYGNAFGNTRVTWRSYPGEHLTGFVSGMGDALSFIQTALSGGTPGSTPCANIQ